MRIKQLTVGDKTFYNLEAHITHGGLDISLLGMSLLREFKDFKITKRVSEKLLSRLQSVYH